MHPRTACLSTHACMLKYMHTHTYTHINTPTHSMHLSTHTYLHTRAPTQAQAEAAAKAGVPLPEANGEVPPSASKQQQQVCVQESGKTKAYTHACWQTFRHLHRHTHAYTHAYLHTCTQAQQAPSIDPKKLDKAEKAKNKGNECYQAGACVYVCVCAFYSLCCSAQGCV